MSPQENHLEGKATNAFEIPCPSCGHAHGSHSVHCPNAPKMGRKPHFTTQTDRHVEEVETGPVTELKPEDATQPVKVEAPAVTPMDRLAEAINRLCDRMDAQASVPPASIRLVEKEN